MSSEGLDYRRASTLPDFLTRDPVDLLEMEVAVQELQAEHAAKLLVRFFGRLFHYLCAVGDAIYKGLEFRVGYERLTMMGDAELAELGLRREDIPAALYQAVVEGKDLRGPGAGIPTDRGLPVAGAESRGQATAIANDSDHRSLAA